MTSILLKVCVSPKKKKTKHFVSGIYMEFTQYYRRPTGLWLIQLIYFVYDYYYDIYGTFLLFSLYLVNMVYDKLIFKNIV